MDPDSEPDPELDPEPNQDSVEMLDSQSADSLLPEDNILVGHPHDL
jgi:hypothetical protein